MNQMLDTINEIFQNQYLAVDEFPNYLKIYDELKKANSEESDFYLEKLSKVLIAAFRKSVIDTVKTQPIEKLNKDKFINCYVESTVSSMIPFKSEKKKQEALDLIKYFNQGINRNAMKSLLITNEDIILKEMQSGNIGLKEIEDDKTVMVFSLNNKRHEIKASAICDYLKDKVNISNETVNNNVSLYMNKNNINKPKVLKTALNVRKRQLTNGEVITTMERQREEYYGKPKS